MKIILPSFAGLLLAASLLTSQSVVAQPPSTPAATSVAVTPPGNTGTPQGNAGELIERMSAAIAKAQSISARVRLHADLFGNQLVGAGVYLQQGVGTDRQMRWEIKIPIGQRVSTLQQVCDGNFLWQFNDMGDKPALSRIDVRRVQQAASAGGAKMGMELPGEMFFGGLPQLVDSLRQSFRFTRMEPGQLDTLPVWIVEGLWQPEALAKVSGDLSKQAAEGKPLDLKKLPPQMPEQVLLYLGQDDLFPYRIEYRRRATSGKKDSAGGELLPILIVEFYEVRLNSPIDPQQFSYQPGGLEVMDKTEQILKAQKGSN